jgi:hypothetical protein
MINHTLCKNSPQIKQGKEHLVSRKEIDEVITSYLCAHHIADENELLGAIRHREILKTERAIDELIQSGNVRAHLGPDGELAFEWSADPTPPTEEVRRDR